MSQPLIIALPPMLNLWNGCIIRVTAVDAVTGNTVPGVRVHNVSFEVATTAEGSLESGPFRLVAGPGA